MTEPDGSHNTHDELLERLTAADPIDQHDLPSPSDPGPRQLLETIMNSSPSPHNSASHNSASHNPGSHNLADSPTAPVIGLPEVRDIERYSGAPRSRRLSFLAVAAAVVLLVAGFALFAPDNATPALATVHSAAEATADFDSGRANTEFSLTAGDGEAAGSVSGVVAAEFVGGDMAVTLDIAEASGEAAGFVAPANEGRLVNGVLYSTDGTDWYSVEAGGFIGRAVTDLIDPRTVLAEVEQLIETSEVGPAVVDGVDTTQFRSVVDLDDESITSSGWLPIEATDLEADGEITVDLYIDGDGVLRRLDVAGDVVEPDGGSGTATMSVSTTFSDLGADISIEAPANATPLTLDGEIDFEELNAGD